MDDLCNGAIDRHLIVHCRFSKALEDVVGKNSMLHLTNTVVIIITVEGNSA